MTATFAAGMINLCGDLLLCRVFSYGAVGAAIATSSAPLTPPVATQSGFHTDTQQSSSQQCSEFFCHAFQVHLGMEASEGSYRNCLQGMFLYFRYPL